MIDVILFIKNYWLYWFVLGFVLFLGYKGIKFLKKKDKLNEKKYGLGIVGILLFTWFFIGYIPCPSGDDFEYSPRFFLKIIPTYQVAFIDLYALEPEVPPLDYLSPNDRATISAYCTHRYAFFGDSNDALRKCIKWIHPDLQQDLDRPWYGNSFD